MISSELAKIRYSRSLRAILFAGIVITAAVSAFMANIVPLANALIRLNEVVPNATDADKMSPETMQSIGMSSAQMQQVVLSTTAGSFFGVGPAVLAVVLVGLLSVTTEFRFGSVVGAVLADPRRIRYVLAKLVAVGTVAGLAVTVIAAINLTTLLISVWAQQETVLVPIITMLSLWGRGVLAAMGYAAIGMGIGFLLRSQVAALIATFAVILAEPVLRVVGRLLANGITVTDFLPFGLAQPSAGANVPLPGLGAAVAPAPLVALAALVVWAIVLLGLGGQLFVRREIILD
jgi:ABC-2 type transport system permease protein